MYYFDLQVASTLVMQLKLHVTQHVTSPVITPNATRIALTFNKHAHPSATTTWRASKTRSKHAMQSAPRCVTRLALSVLVLSRYLNVSTGLLVCASFLLLIKAHMQR